MRVDFFFMFNLSLKCFYLFLNFFCDFFLVFLGFFLFKLVFVKLVKFFGGGSMDDLDGIFWEIEIFDW